MHENVLVRILPSKGKVDILIIKVKSSQASSLPVDDQRGRHESKNKMNEQRVAMRLHIETYIMYNVPIFALFHNF